MFVITLNVALLFICFQVSYCQRRIKNGQVIDADKKYVVYLVKASISIKIYDSWLCGGALVTQDFVITSAACVEDVNFLYVIAGYNKYVNDSNIEQDECTKIMKKKVIFTCVPYAYQFDYDKLSKWSYIDIALAKVESPYDFNDVRYQVVCSYVPSTIPVNYDPKFQGTNNDAVVFGWGHERLWRKLSDKDNHNQESMHYASVLIYDKEKCKEAYKDYPEMLPIIDKYMICSLEKGNIDDDGNPITLPSDLMSGCGPGKHTRMGPRGVFCEDDKSKKHTQKPHVKQNSEESNEDFGMYGRRNMNINKTSDNYNNYTAFVNNSKVASRRQLYFRNGHVEPNEGITTSNTEDIGICQNDHGGPLVTWVGSHEILIGIASVFKVTEENECVGPYLYTSTYCNSAFLDCVINHRFGTTGQKSNMSAARQALCNSPASVKGFDTVEKHISWKNHPAGPAANERHGRSEVRKQTKAPQETDRFLSKKDNSFDVGPSSWLKEKKKPLFDFGLIKSNEEETPQNDRFSGKKMHSFDHKLQDRQG